MTAVRDEFDVPLYFDAKVLGKGLHEVSNEILKTEKSDVKSRWFTGEDGADFFTWQDLSGNFIKAQFTYCGQVFEWNVVSGVRTGVIVEEEPVEVGIKSSEVIRYDSEKMDQTVQDAVALIGHLVAMEEIERDDLLKSIHSNKTIDSMSHEEFWSKYGYGDVKYSKSKSLLGLRILWYHIRKFFHKLD